MKQIKDVTLKSVYRKIVLSFITLTIILILVILYFSFNSVFITITPKKEPIDVDFTVKVEESNSSEEAEIIAGQIFETIVEANKKFDASGSKTLETDVKGKVTMVNESSHDQTLVATTRLLTPDNILFRTKKTVTIKAGEKVEVEVYADNPNLSMAVGPTKFTIPGLWSGLQEKIYATSSEPLSGIKRETAVVTKADIDEAKKILTEDLVGRALEEFKNKITGSDISWKIATKIEELSSNIDAKPDEPKEEFNVGLKLKIGGAALDNEKLLVLAKENFRDNLPSDKELLEIDGSSFKYSVKSYDLNNKRANLDVHLAGLAILKESDSIFDKDKFVGLNKGQIEAYLKNFNSIESAKIRFIPPWFFNAPKLKDHIIIKIER
jgi:hypothetical protein